MRPTFLGFETQKRTLQIAQKNLDITGNNVSNINTPGYTRQRVDLYAEYISGNQSVRWSSDTNNLSLTGQGVNAYGVSQLRDVYIDKRYRENVAVEAETEKSVDILTDIEDVLDNFETDGLQYYTEQFFSALQDYSVEKPDSPEVATIARNTAQNLCRLLNDYDMRLREVEDTYVNELSDTVSYVNNLLNEMNRLNERINRELLNYPDGYGPNELYDEMNLFIDELATYGEIDVKLNSNGTYSVSLGGVKVLDGEKFKTNALIMRNYDENGIADLYFENGQDLVTRTGILRSYENMINGNGVYATGGQNGSYGIAYFKTAINEFANTLAKTFNSANGGDEDPARLMFSALVDGEENHDVVVTAGNIHVSEAWMGNATMIGQVRKLDAATGLYGYGYDEKLDETTGKLTLQNTNVLYLISQINKSNVKFGNANDFSGNFNEYISFISNRLGQTIQYEQSRYDTSQVTVNTLLDARDDVSGVQMDEEGINMLNYQKWYNASSRIVTALDDLLDRLINSTGRVGL